MNKIISKNGLILATFALMVTSIVAVTQYLTKEKIAQQEQKQLLKTLDQVIDRASYDNKLFMHCVPTQSLQFLGSKKTQRAFIAFKGDKPVAVALETTAPNGYNGNINLIVGINFNGIITGVRTLSHQETPGLGDKIELKNQIGFIHLRAIVFKIIKMPLGRSKKMVANLINLLAQPSHHEPWLMP